MLQAFQVKAHKVVRCQNDESERICREVKGWDRRRFLEDLMRRNRVSKLLEAGCFWSLDLHRQP